MGRPMEYEMGKQVIGVDVRNVRLDWKDRELVVLGLQARLADQRQLIGRKRDAQERNKQESVKPGRTGPQVNKAYRQAVNLGNEIDAIEGEIARLEDLVERVRKARPEPRLKVGDWAYNPIFNHNARVLAVTWEEHLNHYAGGWRYSLAGYSSPDLMPAVESAPYMQYRQVGKDCWDKVGPCGPAVMDIPLAEQEVQA